MTREELITRMSGREINVWAALYALEAEEDEARRNRNPGG